MISSNAYIQLITHYNRRLIVEKISWKELTAEDRIFKQGWVLSTPNLSKPRPTSIERTEDADTKGADDSTNVDNTKGENNQIYTQNSNRRQSYFQTRIRNIASKLRSKARTVKSKILRGYRWAKRKIIAIYKN